MGGRRHNRNHLGFFRAIFDATDATEWGGGTSTAITLPQKVYARLFLTKKLKHCSCRNKSLSQNNFERYQNAYSQESQGKNGRVRLHEEMTCLRIENCNCISLGSQHPSPNVKTFCDFEPQIWLEIIISRDARSACFKGSRTSCREMIFGIFWPIFGQKRSHHVMDASCRILNIPRMIDSRLHNFPGDGAVLHAHLRSPIAQEAVNPCPLNGCLGPTERGAWRRVGSKGWQKGLAESQEGTNVHLSDVHFVLCQTFGLNHLTPPFHAFFSTPLLSIASLLSEFKWANASPKKGQAMQRCHEEQSARSKGARLSPLEKGLAERVGERVGEGSADFLAPSNFGIPEAPV